LSYHSSDAHCLNWRLSRHYHCLCRHYPCHRRRRRCPVGCSPTGCRGDSSLRKHWCGLALCPGRYRCLQPMRATSAPAKETDRPQGRKHGRLGVLRAQDELKHIRRTLPNAHLHVEMSALPRRHPGHQPRNSPIEDMSQNAPLSVP
jgi:hypothetical protein